LATLLTYLFYIYKHKEQNEVIKKDFQ